MTEANIPDNQEVVNAESTLDNAIAAIKSESNKPQTFEEVKEEVKEEKRETLKLPVKEEAEKESFDPREFVDVNDPQVQKKINYLYKQVKTSDESNNLLKDELLRLTSTLEEKGKNEEILARKLFAIENRFSKQDEETTLTQLRSQYNEAIGNYDYESAARINEKLVDFKTEIKLAEVLNQQQVQNNPKPKAVANQEYSPQEVAEANRIVLEKNDDGSLVRPWLQKGDPREADAIDLAAAVSNKFIRQTGKRPSLSTVMSEVDKMMGLNSSPKESLRYPPVLSSNTTIGSSQASQANVLSDLQRSYAAKLGIDEKSYARMVKAASSGPISMANFRK